MVHQVTTLTHLYQVKICPAWSDRWKPPVFEWTVKSNIVLQVAEMWGHLEGALGERVYEDPQSRNGCRI